VFKISGEPSCSLGDFGISQTHYFLNKIGNFNFDNRNFISEAF
jgi:hypothetical protein